MPRKTQPKVDRVAQARDTLTAAIERFRSSDDWRAYAAGRKARRRYSFGNRLLIWQQRPDATRVMGFRTWLKFGRCVRAGEKAIWIWVPMRVDAKDHAGNVIRDGNGKPKKKLIFKPGPVFDITQTEPLAGDPPAGGWWQLDAPDAGDTDAAAALEHPHVSYSRLAAAVEEELGVPVESHADPSKQGDALYSLTHRRIWVDSSLNDVDALAALIHEAAHAHRHRQADEGKGWEYATEEVIAEAAAWIVLDGLGISQPSSIPYIAGWQTATAATIESQAEAIDATATAIEKWIAPRQQEGGKGGEDSPSSTSGENTTEAIAA